MTWSSRTARPKRNRGGSSGRAEAGAIICRAIQWSGEEVRLGVFMRPFDLHHLDTDENAEWRDVQSLMDRIAAGAEGKTEFQIWQPDDGPMIVEVALATMDNNDAWILRRYRKRMSYFLARGVGPDYYECIYLGCPEFVRDCCLLPRGDAELGITALIQRRKLQSDWHWIPVTQALERLQGE